MHKAATLKTVMSSTWIAMMHHDIMTRIAFIPFRGASEPVLIIEQSELVGWVRMEGTDAIWRYGSILTGTASTPRNLGNPLTDDGRAIAQAVDLAWAEIQPEWPPAGEDGEHERFAAAIEAGERPAPWSEAAVVEASEVEAPQYVYRPVPPAAAPQPAPQASSQALPDSPYETEFSPYRHDRTRHPAAPGITEEQLDGRILETVYPAAAPAAIGATALFLAILSMPYEFYVLLRVAVPAMAIWICTIASGQKKNGWIVVCALAAILWNPLVPIEMPRTAWVLPDLVGAALFAAAGYTMPASKPALRRQSRA